MKKNISADKENVGVNVGVSDIQRKILEIISKNEKITQKEISTILDVSPRTVERNINILKKKKVFERIGSDKTGCWRILI